MMIHNNQVPFQCSICQKRFREKSNFNFHLKKHRPKFKKTYNKMNNAKLYNFKIKNYYNKNDLIMVKNVNDLYISDNKKYNNLIDYNLTKINNNLFINNNESVLKDKNSLNKELRNNSKIIFKCNQYNINNSSNNLDEQYNYFNNFNNPFINLDYNTNDNIILNFEKDFNFNENYIFSNNNYNEKEKKDIDGLKINLINNNDALQKDNIISFNESDKLNDYNNFEKKCENLNYINNNEEFDINIIKLNKYDFLLQSNDFEYKIGNKEFDDYSSSKSFTA